MSYRIMINFPGFGGGSSEIMLLNLEKLQYHSGEKVKGYLTITSNKDVDSRAFRFIAEGKEETKITVSEPYSSSSSSSSNYSNEYRNVTYTSSNVFFSQDLLEFLKGNSLINIEKVRNSKETVIRKGKTEIPFEFIIPCNTLSSYSGKNAWITYSVKATIDKKMKIDVNSSINFDVISQYDNISISSRPISVSAFKANDLELKLDLDKSVYNIGDTIRGTINIKTLNPDIDIRGTEIILISLEKATASSRTVQTKIYENVYKITNWKEKQNCPFEIDIPQIVTRSYRGRYSDIIWEIKAKVDLPLSQDLNAEAIIEII
jgi:hypothetical protein